MTMTPIHPLVIELLKARGFTKDDIEEFFSWDLKNLPSFKKIHDLEKAADRIVEAITQSQSIAIYGDYDVDGTTSCALLFHFFKLINIEVQLFQPSRFVEGYGIHPAAIDKAKESGVQVLITVDCGITATPAALRAKEVGIDLIVTDHHEDAQEEMVPAFAVVDPSRRDQDHSSDLKNLAGVGVAFALCVEVREKLLAKGKDFPSLYSLLQFVAVGTICDLASLNPMNLKLTRHGLKQLPTSQYPGLRIFLSQDERRLPFTPSEKLSFSIGPMINSKGRLDHPEKALELLTCNDTDIAFNLFSHLDACNKERKLIQSQVFEAAKEQVKRELRSGDLLACIVKGDDWHEGVIGIVASRLVEEFKVPAFVFTRAQEEGLVKASVRSAGELNVFECLQQCEELFTKFGGHKAAAGLSMPEENFPLFKKKMLSILQKIPAIERSAQDSFDLEIDAENVVPQLARDLEKLEPFGMGNKKPVFKTRDLELESFSLMKDVHVRWNFCSKKNPSHKIRGVSFNYIGKYGHLAPDRLYEEQRKTGAGLTIIYTVGINRFNGNEYLQLMVEKVEYQ